MSYRMVAGTCYDGDCPSIFTDDVTGDVIVRGPDATDLTQECDIRFSAATWAHLIAQLAP